MIIDRLTHGHPVEQCRRTWGKLRILVAAMGTLGAAAGIAVVVYGLVQFDETKVITGVAMIVISTIIYVTILAHDRDRIE